MRRPKILYIAGAGRSGSTILDQVLGQVPGFVSTGEFQMIWQRGLIERRPCGCSVPLPECPFWRAVMNRAFGGIDKVSPQAILAKLDPYEPMNTRRLVKLRADVSGKQRRYGHSGARDYGQTMASLYEALASHAGARVVVDSSKTAVGALLAASTGLDLYILHLVRDPRAVAHSWARNARPGQVQEHETPLEIQRAVAFSLDWCLRNLAIELVRPVGGRRLVLRYEDFAAGPERTVSRICDFVDESFGESPFVDDATVVLHENHMVTGNRSRFFRGAMPIRQDDEWRTAMSFRTALLGTVSGLPLLHRYGYPTVLRSAHTQSHPT